MSIDNIIVLIYLAVILVIGLFAGRNIKTFQDYAVSTRSYSTFVLFSTMSASFIGGGFTMGNAERAFTYGIVGSIALCGFSIKELMIAKWIAPKMANFRQAISVGDIMRQGYGKNGQILTGLFAALICVGIVGAQVSAIGYIFESFLGISRNMGIFLGCGIVIVYVTFGGINAVVLTDVVQFILTALGFILLLYFGLEHAGGFEAVKASVPPEHFTFLGSMTLTGFVALFLTFFLGEALSPPYFQRLLIGKSAKEAARGTFFSAIFCIPFFLIAGFIGLIALTLEPTLNPSLAIPHVVKETLPIGIRGLVVACMISVVMSAADSFLNSAAIAMTHDFISPLRKKPLSEKHMLLLGKFFAGGFGCLAVFFALTIQSVLDLIITAYNFWAPTILIPLIVAIFGLKSSFSTLLLSASLGVSSALIWSYGFDSPYEIDGIVIGTLVNGLAFLAMYKLAKPVENKVLVNEVA